MAEAAPLARTSLSPPAASLRERLSAAAGLLRQAGAETPELDARVLLCHAAGLSHEDLVSRLRQPLAPEAADRFARLIARRLTGEPVSRILGARDFYGRSFLIDPSTLDPRPDTETLIDAALAILDRKASRGSPLHLLDFGTGSGAILLTLLAELPQAEGVGADISRKALAIAKLNAARLGVSSRAAFVAGDWHAPIRGAFDLVVSNPPYVRSGAIGELASAVKDFDPLLALDGGPDGLAAYRSLARACRDVLRPGGIVLLEVGADQAEAVLALLIEEGLAPDPERWLWRDLAGRPRVVAANARSVNAGGAKSHAQKGLGKSKASGYVSGTN